MKRGWDRALKVTKMGCNDLNKVFSPELSPRGRWTLLPEVQDIAREEVHRVHKSGRGWGWGGGTGVFWGGARDTERYKGTRYLLEVVRVVGGVGVEVLRHGGNRPLLHGLTRAKSRQHLCKS
jgi:hypothetical protein